MSHGDGHTVTADRVVAAALAGSAAASAAVPDVELEPAALADAALAWRWVVGTDALELYAVLESTPHWRATCIGAGGALHRARVALAAEGLAARVALVPDDAARREPAEPSPPAAPAERRQKAPATGGSQPAPPALGEQRTLLARVTVTGTVEVTAQARALYEATDPEASGTGDGHRETDIRPPRSVVRELVSAARAEGVRLRLVRVGEALVGVLHGPDTREAWLRAGMAASAVRLLARQHGLTAATTLASAETSPTATTRTRRRWNTPQTGATRAGWRRISDREGWLTVGIGTPYLRLRLTG